MTIEFSEGRSRALALPSLAAALLVCGMFGLVASRADGLGRLTPDEMERSRGGDMGLSVLTGNCDDLAGNPSRVASCEGGQVGDTCTSCSGKFYRMLGMDPGAYSSGQVGSNCGRTVFGICQTFRLEGHEVLRCSIPFSGGVDAGKDCLPGPAEPVPQPIPDPTDPGLEGPSGP